MGVIMARKGNVLKKATDLLDIPGEMITGMPIIEISGMGKIRIENHRGLLEYGSDKIEINGGKAVIRITGSGMKIKAMNADVLVISGDIFGLEFSYI